MNIRRKYLLMLLIAFPLLGLAVGWSGLIGVRASTGHWAVTDWFLHWVMRNSVRTASLSTETPRLDQPARLPAAAGHFETGCAICHGSPAHERPEAVMAMLPPPPDLKAVIPTWSDAELFEIVKHGVRFTGMPAWPAQLRDDEVWDMVAFLRTLPAMDANTYLNIAGLSSSGRSGEVSPPATTCDSCHADARLGPDSLIPRLRGQSEVYLLNSLRAYAEGKRPSGIMQVAIGTLPEEQLAELARHYAGKPGIERQSTPIDLQLFEKGKELAEHGRAADKIPACLSCHEKKGGNSAYPRISGQGAAYIERQLHLFHESVRGGSSYSHLMTEAARNLTAEDIAALAIFFAHRSGDASGPATSR